MKSASFSKLILFPLSLTIASFLFSDPGYAATYQSLKAKGYKTGKLTKNRAGLMGWSVQGKGKKYFCQMRVAEIYIGSNRMAIYIKASGRIVEINRKAFHDHLGVRSIDAPQLKDLKAGHPRPQDVGYCTPAN